MAAEDGAPLRRALVGLVIDGRQREGVLTDDAGHFRVPMAAPGRVTLTASKAGFTTHTLTVSLPRAEEPLRFVLARGAVITGRVVDRSGSGVALAIVTARPDTAGAERATEDRLPVSVATDDLGEYRLGGLPAGRYTVSAQAVSVSASSEIWNRLDAGDVPETLRVQLARMTGLPVPDSSASRSQTGVAVTARTGDEVRADFTITRASPPVAFRPPPSPGATSGMRGRVTTRNGSAVSGAVIRVRETRGFMFQTLVDEQGRFSVADLLAGTYTLDVSHGALSSTWYGREYSRHLGTPITLAEREVVGDIEIEIPNERAIAGTITDEHGEPVQGVMVRALHIGHGDGRALAVPVGRPRQTDDRGRYRLFNLPPGAYVVVATVGGVLAGDGARRLDYVPLYYPGTPRLDSASTVHTGDADVSGVDLPFVPLPAARISGEALDTAGNPLVGVVELIARTVPPAATAAPLRVPIGPLGEFVLSQVPAGDYVVRAIGSQGPGRQPEIGVAEVSVGEGDPPPVMIRTVVGATLEGRFVVDGAQGSPTAHVVPWSAEVGLPLGATSAGLVVSSDGSFYANGLVGRTWFRIRESATSWFIKSVTIEGLDATDAPFDFGFTGDTLRNAEIELSPNGAAISGRAVDDGGPVLDYAVVVFSAFPDQWRPHSRFLKFARSTRDGSFRIVGLPPGEYRVAAIDHVEGDEDSGEWQSAAFLERLAAGDARRVTVRDSASEQIELRVARRAP